VILLVGKLDTIVSNSACIDRLNPRALAAIDREILAYLANSPPFDWPVARQQEYFDWSLAVVNGLRGTHAELERLFDQAYGLKPNL
jgi:hypothetical protein